MKKYILLLLVITSVGVSYASNTTIGLTILPAPGTGANNTGGVVGTGSNTGATTILGPVIPDNWNNWIFVGGSYNNVPKTVITLFGNDEVEVLSGFIDSLTNETGFITTGYDAPSGLLIPWPNQMLPIEITTGTLMNVEELSVAYEWAKENAITTKPTSQEARLLDPITRFELAKMIVQFSMNGLGNTITPNETCDANQYQDSDKMNEEEKTYIKLACDANLMGWKNDKSALIAYFNPHNKVTRAEFATVLSRLLYGERYDGDTSIAWFENHLQPLYKIGLLQDSDPLMYEIRGYVMTVLHKVAN